MTIRERVFHWLRRFFARPVSDSPIHIVEPPPAIGHNRPQHEPRQKREDYGTRYYLDDLLECLDDYHESIKLLCNR